MSEQLFGWIPADQMPTDVRDKHEEFVASMPAFSMPSLYVDSGRYALWQIAQSVAPLRYVWQLTGSCVGAGGENMLRTRMRVEIAQGDPEEVTDLWWLYAYGQSRRLAGMNGRGEGSFGSAWAKAIQTLGTFPVDEGEKASGVDLPSFRSVQGWDQVTRDTEFQWSDGAAWNREPWTSLGRKYPVKTVVQVRSTEQLRAGLASGHNVTIASNFGTRTIRPTGSPAVNIALYDATWPHQMHVDEAWDHPSLKWIYRIGNNWGPGAHPAPTQGEPAGGFYVTESTMQRILSERYTECYLFSAFEGIPLRKLNWVV